MDLQLHDLHVELHQLRGDVEALHGAVQLVVAMLDELLTLAKRPAFNMPIHADGPIE